MVLVHGKRPHADSRAGVRRLRDLLRSEVRVVVERFHLDRCRQVVYAYIYTIKWRLDQIVSGSFVYLI